MVVRTVLCTALVRFLILGPLAAQATVNRTPGLEPLRFLAGCWVGVSPSGVAIEEQYTTPTENLILGVTRYVRGGRTRSFEFSTIRSAADGSVLTPHPGGVASVAFHEVTRSAELVTWENPTHDFPQRVTYHRFIPDSLRARIERLDGTQSTEYRMGRRPCGIP